MINDNEDEAGNLETEQITQILHTRSRHGQIIY